MTEQAPEREEEPAGQVDPVTEITGSGGIRLNPLGLSRPDSGQRLWP